MEINMITKNSENEMIRINYSNKKDDYNSIIVKEFDKNDVFINGYELPLKSIIRFVSELETEKNAQIG